MAGGDRQRVGGVVAECDRRRHPQRLAHHRFDLRLVGGAEAGDRHLDLRRRVLVKLQPALGRRQHRDRPRLAEPEGALDVERGEVPLQAHRGGFVLCDQLQQPFVDVAQAERRGRGAGGADGARGDVAEDAGGAFDDSEPGCRVARIDPDNPHAPTPPLGTPRAGARCLYAAEKLASTSSSISKLAATLCTSSWSSSSSTSRSTCSAACPETLTLFSGTRVSSLEAIAMPAFSSASRTALKRS